MSWLSILKETITVELLKFNRFKLKHKVIFELKYLEL